jgi:hypothetical protein
VTLWLQNTLAPQAYLSRKKMANIASDEKACHIDCQCQNPSTDASDALRHAMRGMGCFAAAMKAPRNHLRHMRVHGRRIPLEFSYADLCVAAEHIRSTEEVYYDATQACYWYYPAAKTHRMTLREK